MEHFDYEDWVAEENGPSTVAEIEVADDETLREMMGSCSAEPADFDAWAGRPACPPCYAYKVVQDREDAKRAAARQPDDYELWLKKRIAAKDHPATILAYQKALAQYESFKGV